MSTSSTINQSASPVEVAVHNVTLTAAQVDTVTFTGRANSVEVIGDGLADIYFTTDGSAPTVGGKHCYKLPAGVIASRIVGSATAPAVVKLISAGTPTYSVCQA